jgi:Uma2 family endonuclease
MATATTVRHTPEDLLAITDRPMPELVDGELVEREMGQKSDAIAFRIGRWIGNHAEANNLGLVNGAQGSYQIFPDDPNKVRIPDVSFTRQVRLPSSRPAEGHARVAPDLVVEVVSPHDSFSMVEAKIKDYRAAGIPLIWLVDPETQVVRVFRPNRQETSLYPGDTLEGEDVLPGFRVEVAALFAGLI